MKGKLFLFPVPIGADDIDESLPPHNLEHLNTCLHFIVEEVRTARRFLKHVGYVHPLDETSGGRFDSDAEKRSASFQILNEHTSQMQPDELAAYLAPIFDGDNIGLLSEAGLPCVADPGVRITRLAHTLDIDIVPLVGPSSLMLALMASGLNGQNFAFIGYLPVDKVLRRKTLRMLEQRVRRERQTQIFIEAPYRNNQLLEALCETLSADILVTVATDLTMPTQQIVTKSVAQWRQHRLTLNLHKRNTVFLMGCW